MKRMKRVIAITMIISMMLTLVSVSSIQAENINDDFGLMIQTDMPKIKANKFIVPIGTPVENSIPISDKEKLKKIGKDEGYPLSGAYHLTNDIDLNGEEWVPIGNNSTTTDESRFTGTFDGQGYVIKNLKVTGGYQYAGLFGYVSNAKINNIGLENTFIEVSFLTAVYAGGICGYASDTIISNCFNTGEVTVSAYDSTSSITSCSYAGGIYGSDSNATISNCYNTGEVTSSATNSSYAGGIGGYSSATISNCYNTGKVSSFAYNSKAGGICGASASASISNCYNKGEMISSATASSYAGGICGTSSSAISNCYNTGKMTTTTSATSSGQSSYSGGICGTSVTTGTTSGIISNCYNTGEVTSTATDAGGSRAGGICGSSRQSIISNCYNTGEVTSSLSSSGLFAGGICGYDSDSIISNCYNTVKVTATTTSRISVVGGICGYSSGDTTISHCYNTGVLTASSSSATPMYVCSGGIIGFGPGTTTSNCYNTGKVTSSISTTSSGSYAGGIYGYGAGNTIISNCYNAGEVIPVSSNSGGICGTGVTTDTSSISNCYWNRDINPSIKGVGGAGSGNDTTTSYTTLEMKGEENKANYEGFDFDVDWRFETGENDYPILRIFDVLGITLNKAKTTILIGSKETLVASIVSTNKTVTWSSGNTAVATVDEFGVVTAISVGEAVITATIEGNLTASCTVSVVAPSYAILLEKVFPTATVGYVAQTPHEISVTNTGTEETSVLNIALSGTNATSFTLNKTEITNIEKGGSTSFTVVPNTGLAVGVYTATITVSGDNGISAVFHVKFEVTSSTATAEPTSTPPMTPTAEPTSTPSMTPTAEPTSTPTMTPTANSTTTPTASPIENPTAEPTVNPAIRPTTNAEPTSNTISIKKQLPKPTKLKLTTKKATWKNVENNNGYTIKIIQEKKVIKTSQIKKGKTSYLIKKKLFKKGKRYKFTIVAKGKGKYKNSKIATSKIVTIKK